MRLIVAIVVAWMVVSTTFAQAPERKRAYTLIYGVLKATEQEAQEGYFAIGENAMLVVKPGSTPHQVIRQELLDSPVQLVIVRED